MKDILLINIEGKSLDVALYKRLTLCFVSVAPNEIIKISIMFKIIRDDLYSWAVGISPTSLI